MHSTEARIHSAKLALTESAARYAGIGTTSALKSAIAEAEATRADFADYRNLIAVALKDIERAVEFGTAFASHDFHDPHYSKITTGARGANFRRAMRALDVAHTAFLDDIAGHRAMLARTGFAMS